MEHQQIESEEIILEVAVEPAKKAAPLWPMIREIIEILVLSAIIWMGVNFMTARYIVNGSSMEPNLHTGQFLLVNRLSYLLEEPQRGDVIVFRYPYNLHDNYVKRVIGLPGDHVVIEENKVYVNGKQLWEPYLSDENSSFTYRSNYDVIVPEGSYFVLGDNRIGSSDSRSWGMLENTHVIGKAWISYWPIEDWGVLPHYAEGTTF